MGAPKWPPYPPFLLAPRQSRGAPRASSQLMGAPTSPPPFLLAPRQSRGAPRASSQLMGAPTSPPQFLLPPRQSRGAPRASSQVLGAPTSPPHFSSRPGKAVARLDQRPAMGPEMARRRRGTLDYRCAAIASAMRSGVIGSSVSRTPVASSIALAMAAGAGTIGGSPTPRAPNGPAGDGFSTMMVSMFGSSAAVSLR